MEFRPNTILLATSSATVAWNFPFLEEIFCLLQYLSTILRTYNFTHDSDQEGEQKLPQH